MGIFRDMIEEARQSTVPTEYRIALGQLKRMYNDGEVPEKKELLKDVEMIAKKNHLDSDKFLEFALAQFKINESVLKFKVGDIVNLDVNSIENSEYVNQFPCKNVPKSVKIISPKINVNGDFTFEVPKYKGKEAILPKKFILESAVGKPGRTTEKDAEDHIDDELVAEFRKIIKKLGGKTVAKVLLDKLGQKSEIKDEIEHIEDMIDNSNY